MPDGFQSLFGDLIEPGAGTKPPHCGGISASLLTPRSSSSPAPKTWPRSPIQAAEKARRFDREPRIAILSFSKLASRRQPLSTKVRRAVELVRECAPGLMIDGEMQADTAVVWQIIGETYSFSTRKGGANVLIFPNLEGRQNRLQAAPHLGGVELVGPLLTGLSKPVHVLQRGSEVNDIVQVAAVAVVDAQAAGRPYPSLARVTPE